MFSRCLPERGNENIGTLFVSRTQSAPTCTFGGLWRAAFGAAIYCRDCSMQSLYRRYHVWTFVARLRYVNPLRTATSAFLSFINMFVLSILTQSTASRITSRAMRPHHACLYVLPVKLLSRVIRNNRKPPCTMLFAMSTRRSSEVLSSKGHRTRVGSPVHIVSSSEVRPFLSSARIRFVVGHVHSSTIRGKNLLNKRTFRRAYVRFAGV